MDYMIDDTVPLGFGMALAQNRDAVIVFGRMSKEQRDTVIKKAREANSKDEMREIVRVLAENGANSFF
ncbi:MAG: hypothetical protein VB118_10100 [Oscillospiraceae bacterium]|nr:hypothetical protein [Oscillospiraceae bacterium]